MITMENAELETQQSFDAEQREVPILSYEEVQRSKRQKLQHDLDFVDAEADAVDQDAAVDYDDNVNHQDIVVDDDANVDDYNSADTDVHQDVVDDEDKDNIDRHNDDEDQHYNKDEDDKGYHYNDVDHGDSSDNGKGEKNDNNHDDDDDAPTFPHFNKFPKKLLPIILNKLSLEQKVRIVPLVCKKWYNLWKSESELWRKINFIPWQIKEPFLFIPKILSKLRKRVRFFVRNLHIRFLFHRDLTYVLRRVGHWLEWLTVHCSDMTDEWANQHAHRLPNCKHLDLSQCDNLTEVGILELHRQCPSLSVLCVPRKALEGLLAKKVCGASADYFVPGNGYNNIVRVARFKRALHPPGNVVWVVAFLVSIMH